MVSTTEIIPIDMERLMAKMFLMFLNKKLDTATGMIISNNNFNIHIVNPHISLLVMVNAYS